MNCPPCQCVDRRVFLQQVAAILGVTGVAACSASLQPITAFTVKLSDYPSLASIGGLAVVDDGSRTGSPIAVSRTADRAYLALSLVCPHRGITVQLSGPAFYCPGHGATFAADGTWTGGQPTSSLSRYATSYDTAAGTLRIG